MRENVRGRERERWVEDSGWGNGRKENKERGRDGRRVGSEKGRKGKTEDIGKEK